MRILLRIAFRNLREHKTKTVIIGSIIALANRLPALDYGTMAWTRMVEPIEFWGPIGKAARIAREASARAEPSGTAAARGRLGEPGNAVSGDPAPIGAAMADDDEIPF